MQVVGYYQANELCDDMELGPFGKTIAEKIRAQCKHAAVLMVRAAACVLGCPHPSHLVAASCEQVDGAKMHPTEDNLRLVPVLSSASVPAPTLSEPAATLETLELALGRGAFRDPKCPHVATRSLAPAACARAGVQHNVVDFDEHLDDASKDWFNTSLLS